jgi:hypothetical protein
MHASNAIEDGDVDSADLDCFFYNNVPTNVGLTSQKVNLKTHLMELIWLIIAIGTGVVFWVPRQIFGAVGGLPAAPSLLRSEDRP